jgi:hypothetical protein
MFVVVVVVDSEDFLVYLVLLSRKRWRNENNNGLSYTLHNLRFERNTIDFG